MLKSSKANPRSIIAIKSGGYGDFGLIFWEVWIDGTFLSNRNFANGCGIPIAVSGTPTAAKVGKASQMSARGRNSGSHTEAAISFILLIWGFFPTIRLLNWRSGTAPVSRDGK